MSVNPDVGMPDSPLEAPVSRSFLLSLLGYVASVAFVVVGGTVVATYLHTEAWGTCLIFGGLTVIVATLIRPAFFWRHRNVKFIRALLGERGATAFYLLVGTGVALVGADRVIYWIDAKTECAQRAATALDSHQRMDVLQSRPNVARTGVLSLPGTPQPRTCDQYLHYNAF